MITVSRHPTIIYCVHAVSTQQQLPKCFELIGTVNAHMFGMQFYDSFNLYLIDGLLLCLLTDKAIEPMSPVRLATRICEEFVKFGVSLNINVRRI